MHPFPGKKSVNVPLNKVTSYNCYENGIEIWKDGREKSSFFAPNGSVEVLGLCLGHLLGNISK